MKKQAFILLFIGVFIFVATAMSEDCQNAITCDVDGNGVANILDISLMIKFCNCTGWECMMEVGEDLVCPDETFDCDGMNSWGGPNCFDDVYCCIDLIYN